MSNPIFIVAMPRSGTKLLRELLDNHSKIYFLKNETEFLPYLSRLESNLGPLNQFENFKLFYKSILKTSFFYKKSLENNIPSCDIFFNGLNGYNTSDIFKYIVEYYTDSIGKGKEYWGDKSPSYINHLNLIFDLYPSAKIIHIVRDPRDYCLSMKKAWGKSLVRSAYKWEKSISKINKRDHRIIEIKYEDLIQKPDVELLRICSFLDLEYEPDMVKLNNKVENLGDTKNNIAIVKNNQGKFMQGFKKNEIKMIESICYSSMRDYSYDVEKPSKEYKPSKLELYKLKVYDIIKLLLFSFRELGMVRGFKLRYYSRKNN